MGMCREHGLPVCPVRSRPMRVARTGELPEQIALDDDLVIEGENADVLGRLPDAAFDLVYVAPPFNTGKAQRRGAMSYADVHTDYLGFLRPRLNRARGLPDHGGPDMSRRSGAGVR